MRCPCGVEMQRRADGAWARGCACKTKRYQTNVAPGTADAVAYHQLTGKVVPRTPDRLWQYGPP